MTPPLGTFVTAVTGYFSGQITGTISLGSFTQNAGFKAALSTGMNLLYVLDHKLLGGNLGPSITVPTVKCSDGMVDVIPRVQLGWQHGDFAHTIYLEAISRI